MYKINTDSVQPDDEPLLLSKISLGDETAFRILFDRYRDPVYGYALKIIKVDTLAEEILHDVFLKIWQHKNLAEIENIRAFLRVVTKNTSINVLRRQKLEMVLNNHICNNWQEAHNETEESILLHESAAILNQGINLLTPQQKVVYMLCKNEGLKYAQAAERLSISTFTVKTHMKQVLRFLRNHISKHSDFALYVLLLQLLQKK